MKAFVSERGERYLKNKPMKHTDISGWELIKAERQKQPLLGYSDEHDDCHVNKEIAQAALAYLGAYLGGSNPHIDMPRGWVYNRGLTDMGQLIFAGGLIASEIDRIKRELQRRLEEMNERA